MSSAEKRLYPRMPVFAGALITGADEGYSSEVRDVSRGGARLSRPSNWKSRPDGAFRIYFVFENEIVIALEARCLRESSESLAFEFLPGQEMRIGSLLHESLFLNYELANA